MTCVFCKVLYVLHTWSVAIVVFLSDTFSVQAHTMCNEGCGHKVSFLPLSRLSLLYLIRQFHLKGVTLLKVIANVWGDYCQCPHTVEQGPLFMSPFFSSVVYQTTWRIVAPEWCHLICLIADTRGQTCNCPEKHVADLIKHWIQKRNLLLFLNKEIIPFYKKNFVAFLKIPHITVVGNLQYAVGSLVSHLQPIDGASGLKTRDHLVAVWFVWFIVFSRIIPNNHMVLQIWFKMIRYRSVGIHQSPVLSFFLFNFSISVYRLHRDCNLLTFHVEQIVCQVE